MVRVQVLLDDDDKARLQRQAQRDGVSLSAWLREAALARLAELQHDDRPAGPEELRAFFEQCDAREKGTEPDWDEHLEVMARSRRAGSSET
jgi:hypothetical protein